MILIRQMKNKESVEDTGVVIENDACDKNYQNSPVPPSNQDEDKWDRDSPDEDTFSVSSSDSSCFDSEETEERAARLRRTKKFIKEEYNHSMVKNCPKLESRNDVRPSGTTVDLDLQSYYSPALNIQESKHNQPRSYKSSRPSVFSHKYDPKNHLEPASKDIHNSIEGYYSPRMKTQECHQPPIKTISLRQSMEIGFDRVPVTQLSDGGSPRITKKTVPRFGGRVKIFGKWF
jgi:hypothetical protein